ncbi:zinc-binding dehydrogenase [Nocardia altamirensis]|uniref:zinc-binding dehydrogenase n=1 Tax=Nocardia altamirensis TaxID=472158 RepID=UPI0008401EB5|nr:zinc-binding dehydrogenase [Nocardia altamirensis]
MRIDDARRARAAVLESIGAPPVLREFDILRPGPGQLLVACSYGGICGTDLHLQQGHLPIPVPIVLGHEGLGVIGELGPGVVADALGAPLQPGDRVMWASSIACGVCVPCRQYREPTLCEARQTYGVNRSTTDEPLSGAWADHILLQPGTTVVRLADSVTDLAAMSLACAGPTLIHALYERRPVRLGETVIVQGSGPVGLAAAAFAQLAGAAQVIVVGGPAHRLDIAKSCGIGDAHLDIIGAADQSAVLDQARQLTGGRGADLVIECTGVPAAVQQGITLARRGGALLIVGQYTDAGPTPINPHHIVRQQLDVLGSWAFTGAHLVEYVRLLPTLTNRFDLASLVSVFPLAQCADAMAAVAAGSVMKAVLAGAGISETD